MKGILLTQTASDGLDKLFVKIFETEDYNTMLRPHDNNGITHVNTELKLLQIDLDEKYQELIATVWIEMVISDLSYFLVNTEKKKSPFRLFESLS